MTDQTMRIERDGAIARLVFAQGERGNPINGDFCAAFLDAANTISDDRSIRAVLIVAEGKNFSFGGDIATFVDELDRLPGMIRRWTSALHAGIARFARMDAPVVVAVQGMSAGGMNGLVAGADYVVTSKTSRYLAAYTGIAFCADAGTSVMLSRRMGIARAKRFLMMNELLDAEAALVAGLVDELADPDDYLARAEAVARQLADGPTRAFGELRRLFLSVEDQPLETQLELEALALARCAGTADAREGITAFAEKRKPAFKGE
ncbi:enoyl-CoA hydratase/isomerase family protein [Novosphingobium sp. BL-52-GroH]|uniref:enoyl-CoA hydratase/isomerase family protein n=1 Tax=Novosphingobium sp. BL-52-GroH TaxID=3349877 RepID=UPI003850C492